MSEHVKEVGLADFDAEVLKSDLPVVVDFWAPWCGPCKAAAPHFEALAVKYAEQAKFVKVNVDNEQELAKKYHVQSIPTFKSFKRGKIIEHLVGFNGVDELEKSVTRAIVYHK